MNQNSFRNLISGADKRLHQHLIRFLLWNISQVYRFAVATRNFCYDKSLFKTHKADVPVISIGNITTGGTGKTPLVIWLCKLLTRKSYKCAILTRGYKTDNGRYSDEPAILKKSCPNVKVLIDSNRTASARKAVKEFNANVLVMDDGFQHRRLKRDLDIIAIDATCPFGYGKHLPAGLLRESIDSITRADAVVITRYDQVSEARIEELEKTILVLKPDITLAKAIHYHPYALLDKGKKLTIGELCKHKVFAFCGIGNPDAFFNRLEEYEISVVDRKTYNDHHNYTVNDIEDIYQQAKDLNATAILTTEKDWIKTTLLKNKNEDIIFAYLALELDFIDGTDKIVQMVEKTISNYKTKI